MKKPNKIYTLTVVYNEDKEEVEYLQESVCVDGSEAPEKSTMLVDFTDYWDEDTIRLLRDSYYLAEA